MRRWTMTLFLAATAAAAALIAPQLIGQPTPEKGCPHALTPPATVAPTKTIPKAPAVAPIQTIPEIQTPPPTAQPKPVPDEFWEDAVDCGMG